MRCTNWAKSTPIELHKHTSSQWEECGAAIGEAADIKLDQSFIRPRRTTRKPRGIHHNCSLPVSYGRMTSITCIPNEIRPSSTAFHLFRLVRLNKYSLIRSSTSSKWRAITLQ